MTNYKQAKQALKQRAIEAKKIVKDDKPALRQFINDNAFYLSQDHKLSEYQCSLLHNYACELHP